MRNFQLPMRSAEGKAKKFAQFSKIPSKNSLLEVG